MDFVKFPLGAAETPRSAQLRNADHTMAEASMELGLYSFAEVTPDPVTGETISPAERLNDLLEEIELADRLGLDVFGLGEHHRPDFAASAPAVVLAAAAQRTKRIRLTSAVSVLSSDDPVRVFQQFSTLDLLSGGRAEIMAGRGSFIESFPLFGYDLQDYDDLFAEKLDLLLKLRDSVRVIWSGTTSRADRRPRRLPAAAANAPAGLDRGRRHAQIGVAGRDARAADGGRDHRRIDAAVRADRQLLPGGGAAKRTRSRRAAGQHQFARLRRGDLARGVRNGLDLFRTGDAAHRTGTGMVGRNREQLQAEMTLPGALVAGSPEQVIEKILYQHELFGHQRFLLQISVGTTPHDKVMKSIELFGTRVAPVVRAEIAKRRVITPAIAMP